MIGLIVRMEIGSDGFEPKHYLRVFPSGEIEVVNKWVRSDVAEGISRLKADSQLLTIRHLSLMGWTLSNPSRWEEAEA